MISGDFALSLFMKLDLAEAERGHHAILYPASLE